MSQLEYRLTERHAEANARNGYTAKRHYTALTHRLGKTLAFLLPVLSRISPKIAGVQALVIVPSRELALQIDNVLRKIAAGIKIVCCYGGHSVREESKSLAVAPALIVGTPGRIADHIRRGRIVLETLDTLVLDEFDKCLALGFQDEMQEIIAPLEKRKEKDSHLGDRQ